MPQLVPWAQGEFQGFVDVVYIRYKRFQKLPTEKCQSILFSFLGKTEDHVLKY